MSVQRNGTVCDIPGGRLLQGVPGTRCPTTLLVLLLICTNAVLRMRPGCADIRTQSVRGGEKAHNSGNQVLHVHPVLFWMGRKVYITKWDVAM